MNPRTAWSDPAAYETQARRLAARFHDNFVRFPRADAKIRAAGPRV
jgi:phosphoenolpyruvate carboxykinase (ATP)